MTELYKQFIANKNKGLVWNLLYEDGAFDAVPENKVGLIKADFDRKFETIGAQINPNDNLINLDKRVISEMIEDIKKHRENREAVNREAGREAVNREAGIKNAEALVNRDYNTAEISQRRQKVFQEELSNKQKDFDKFNNTPVPDKIDFADALDSPIGSEMDKILAEQIALREKQLHMVLKTQDKEAATKWIQNPSTDEPAKLKIGENVNLDVQMKMDPQMKIDPPVKLKKVNFLDLAPLANDNNDDNFLALLKKKEITNIDTDNNNDTDTLSLLREILKKQNQILELLSIKLK
jgi:hypothetical protein